ncbi:uncharacterized protein EDB91DRAFT_1140061 [Suillus paluster]|uniref:uncharacterized protein n=1 Tax=Suillus paluster TaxID=48578 RepID=UPI001B878A27|nr:uncharacterized protein EDB91DRAFT_1140061 [Suillus paluster]KAG1737477.1 hypothetical protein EDB91DRAFT_1140061 [Suillus paluster]
MSDTVWRPEDDPNIRPPLQEGQVYRSDILDVIETSLDGLSGELRTLSLDIHDHPELKFEEKYAHDTYTAFMEKHGFIVTKNYHLETAWMDALPGIGHACGHNLIGMSGVAVALAAKAAMENLNIDGKVILLGTPAEEGGFGKVMLYEKGAYDEMDVCLMCHPAPGPRHSISLSGCLAISRITVEYQGHTAHAGLSPWEGQNALDAAVLAYNNVSLLRQQIKPTHRVHGIFEGKDWAPNIIPDHAIMQWLVRAPTTSEMEDTRKRVISCFESVFHYRLVRMTKQYYIFAQSGCTRIWMQSSSYGWIGRQRNQAKQSTCGLVLNVVPGDELADVVLKRYGAIDYEWGIKSASTDFVSVSHIQKVRES